MIHLFQSFKDGKPLLLDVPVPRAAGAAVVVESHATVVSVGTERMVLDFGRASWLERARKQPEKVLKAVEKVRTDGIAATVGVIRSHLDTPIATGYCQAGTVREVGADVTEFSPGDRVVTNGPHAEFVRVPRTLAAKIPDGVSFEAAAFTPLAAIGLQGLRLANPTLGETVVVYGLGIIGLLTVQLARAAGCRVIAVDRVSERCATAERHGAASVVAGAGVDVAAAVMQMTNGVGADAVLLTLATESDEPMHVAATMSRKRGRVVLIGVTGLKLDRNDFYAKELSFQVSCSYGPGRYDPEHEERGQDYPLPFVRWTERRNFEAVLELMADGRLDPLPLVSHRFSIREAAAAYDTVATGEALGVVLTYPGDQTERTIERTVRITDRPTQSANARIGWVGAGSFSKVLIPAFAAAGADLHTIASSGGTSATLSARQHGFRYASTEAERMLTDADIDTLVIATRHNSHADWVTRALTNDKNAFVEKPLAITQEELGRISDAVQQSNRLLCVGFNRRFAPHVAHASSVLSQRVGPLAISITINAGRLPPNHWTLDPLVGGGRIVGEGCHFIDLARFLAGSAIRRVGVVSAARADDHTPITDQVSMHLTFEDGSIATIQYLSNGHKTFPKERIELFFDGRILRIDDFKTLEGWGVSVPRSGWRQKADKGHFALAAAFTTAVQTGGPSPIPVEQVLEVSKVSIIAQQLAVAGGGYADVLE
jgi:predicted dehydrogenase/threonine dehydrogenase-like Zn-dependent dehydrogenase